MSGLDKMKSQILDEAAHTAEEKIAEAEAKAEKILKDARAEAALQAGKISDKAQADAEHYAQRIASSCEMQRRQAILRAKQEVIADVLDKAYDRLLNLDTEAYFEMIRKMCIRDRYLISGGYDLLVTLEGKTLKEVSRFVSEKLSPIDAVISTATYFILKKYKDHGTVLVPKKESERMLVTP